VVLHAEEIVTTDVIKSAGAASFEVSRRRVLQGVAWATPAVLIATAAPAFAASGPRELGAILFVSAGGAQSTADIGFEAYIAYVGAGEPTPDYPVDNLTVTVSVPTARYDASRTPAVVGTGDWTFSGPVSTSGANTLVTFAWNGTLTAAIVPSKLQVVLPKHSDRTEFSISATANGTSNGTSVQATSDLDLVLGAYSVFNWNSPPQVTYTEGSGSPRYAHVQFAVQSALGWPSYNTRDIVGVTATVTLPTSAVAVGDGAIESWISEWAYQGRSSDVSAGTTTFTFVYTANGGAMVPSYNPSQLALRIPRNSTTSSYTYTVIVSGNSPTASGAVASISATATG
jgi:hypothetical protein